MVKVIFIKDLKKQGKVNDIKDVADGYATNFLIANGYAVKYTKTSNDRLNTDIKNKRIKDDQDEKNAKDLAKKIASLNITFSVKSGKDGKAFGSISTKQISKELKELGYTIDKKKIMIDLSLNTIGVHYVKVVLHKKVDCQLKITLQDK